MLVNVAKRERNLRLLIAVLSAICIWRLRMPPWADYALGAVAVVSLVTGLLRYCPLNHLFKVKSAS
ncbi:MAG: DUF2892 domain-containing protein [Deltaproteobacteria bacterium]|nr:DUF2892 domain-containing protein [Deltaproteobacteria bacterium]